MFAQSLHYSSCVHCDTDIGWAAAVDEYGDNGFSSCTSARMNADETIAASFPQKRCHENEP